MICDGCDEPIAVGEDGRVWCSSPLGMCALVVHRRQACGRAALDARLGYKMLAGNRPPLSKAEKAKLEVAA